MLSALLVINIIKKKTSSFLTYEFSFNLICLLLPYQVLLYLCFWFPCIIEFLTQDMSI